MDKTEQLIIAIQQVARKLREIKEKEVRKMNLQDFSLSNFRYIEKIYELGNPTFMELTKELGLSKPSITITVGKLIEKGIATKEKSQEDGRVFTISLTRKGEKIILGYNKIYEEFVNQVASKYTEKEKDTLISLLSRM